MIQSKIAVISRKFKELVNRLRSALLRNKGTQNATAPASVSTKEPCCQNDPSQVSQASNLCSLENLTDDISKVKRELPRDIDQAARFDNMNEETLAEVDLSTVNFAEENLAELDLTEEGRALDSQFLNKTLEYRDECHDYQLFIPSKYQLSVKKGLRLPLVVMLHGCTQSSEDFAAGTQMNELAERNNCLIVYPTQPASANHNRCWNWYRVSDQQNGQGEPAWLAELTQTIIEEYTVDASRVYIAGLSAGAAMAVIMAETHPELYAAVGVHSGLAYGSATNLPTAMMAMHLGGSLSGSQLEKNTPFVPMIVFHGDQDLTVSIRNGEQIFTQAKQRLFAQKTDLQTSKESQPSVQGGSSTQIKISDSQGTSQLEYWKIHGAGHSWAGGSETGSYTDPLGPPASEEMMRFFLSHQQPSIEDWHCALARA